MVIKTLLIISINVFLSYQNFNLKEVKIFKETGSSKFYGFSVAFQANGQVIISDSNKDTGFVYEYALSDATKKLQHHTVENRKFFGSHISRSPDATFQYIWNYLDYKSNKTFYKQPGATPIEYTVRIRRPSNSKRNRRMDIYHVGEHAEVISKTDTYVGNPLFNITRGQIIRCDLTTGAPCIAFMDTSKAGASPRQALGRYFKLGNIHPSPGNEVIVAAHEANYFKGCLFVYLTDGSPTINVPNVSNDEIGKIIDTYFEICFQEREFTGFGFHFAIVPTSANSYDYIVVGMPFDSVNGHESGSISIITPKRVGNMMEYDIKVLFSGKKWSRLGYYVHNVKDIDSNGFEDVIVGAPYENKGVLYVFYQTRDGFHSEHHTKIDQSEIGGDAVEMFGYSLDVFDTNSDGRYELLLGGLGRAIYMVPLPQAMLKFEITPSTTSLDFLALPKCTVEKAQRKCLDLKMCRLFSGIGVSRANLKFQINIREQSLDKLNIVGENRYEDTGMFERTKTGELYEEISVHKRSSATFTEEDCYSYRFVLGDHLRVNHNLQFNFTTVLDPAIKDVFVNDEIYKEKIVEIPVTQACDDTNRCKPDISLEMSSSIGDGQILKEGEAFKLLVNITSKYKKVTNLVGHLHTTNGFSIINVRYSLALTLNLILINNGVTHKPLSNRTEGISELKIINKLYPNKNIQFTIIMQSREEVKSKLDSYTFRLVVSNDVEEDDMTNNEVSLTLPFKVESHIIITGLSYPSLATISGHREPKNNTIDPTLVHTYPPLDVQTIISNGGPHDSPSGIVEMNLPVALKGAQIVYFPGLEESLSGKEVPCSEINTVQSNNKDLLPTITKNSKNAKKTNACPVGSCYVVKCSFQKVEARRQLKVTANGFLRSGEIFKRLHVNGTQIIVTGKIKFNSVDKIITDSPMDFNITIILRKNAAELSFGSIPIWFFIIAIVSSLAIVSLLSLVLHKIGVFKRKKFEKEL